MSTIQNLFQQAQLAEAAYTDLVNVTVSTNPSELAAILANPDLDGKFSLAQAASFVTHWRVVDQYTSSGLFQSGFSGTLFESLDHPGQYSFSLRGTQPGFYDLSADIGDIVADGIALDQIVDMYNYWQRLTTSGFYQAAKLETRVWETVKLELLWAQTWLPGGPAIYANYVAELQAGGIVVDMGPLGPSARKVVFGDSNFMLKGTLAVGSGHLASSAVVDVDGHSLGGHLAMAFSRLFPSATSDVVAINGAGFDYSDGNVDTLFTALKGVPGFDAGKITNVVGSAAMNLVSQHWLFLQQPAGRKEIYTESAGINTTLGHGSSQMTDSLALYNLFAQLDPTLNTNPSGLQIITDILKASSNVLFWRCRRAAANDARIYETERRVA